MIVVNGFVEAVRNARDYAHQISKDHGFWNEGEMIADEDKEISGWQRPWNFAEKIALIHSELSEALEKHRKTLGKGLPDVPDEHCSEFGGITIELADAVIRILDLAGKMDLPLGEAILAKMNFNRSRPKKHGKAY